MSGQDTIYQMITDRMIAALEKGTIPWHKPWAVRNPVSMSTGKTYRGINPFILAQAQAEGGYTSPYWGSIKRINALGGKVRKGEKPTVVIFWKRLPIIETDQATGETKKKIIAMLRYYKVWNAEQCEGLEDKYYPAATQDGTAEVLEDAEIVWKRYLAEGGPTLTENDSQAFYAIDHDMISLPPRGAFDGPDEFYATAFHEATHSTGHPTRLDIPESGHNHFGNAKYSAEELRAEMGAAMLCASTGIHATFDNSASYIANWLGALRGDHRLVIKAAARAQKASDMILGITYGDDADE